MRKYYYVCPRCGRHYKHYIPRRKAKCGFCSTVWKTRGAKGTRSAFSWTATLTTLLALAAIVFFVGREYGVFSLNLDDVPQKEHFISEPSLEPSQADDLESDASDEPTFENAAEDASEDVETANDAENAAAE